MVREVTQLGTDRGPEILSPVSWSCLGTRNAIKKKRNIERMIEGKQRDPVWKRRNKTIFI